ncbi:MAG: sulfate reduction electron transfer complex DsrMKJOP subunit DsrJ [Desulfonatronovibrionaceae bacterium]
MYDGGKIIVGLAVFVVLFTFPFWFNIGSAAYEEPELQEAKEGKECVLPTQEMRAEHMQLLDDWRDDVVREEDHYYHSSDGKVYWKSLTMTCMKCHTDKEKFCDKCHNSVDVSPYCWDCHVIPEGGE